MSQAQDGVAPPAGEPSISRPMPAIGIALSFPTFATLQGVLQVLNELVGVQPVHMNSTASALRTYLGPIQLANLILNVPNAQMEEELGPHAATLALVVPDRAAMAERAAQILRERGLTARVHHYAEREVDPRALSFVSITDPNSPNGEQSRVLLMVWPTPEEVTPEMRAAIPRLPWNPAMLTVLGRTDADALCAAAAQPPKQE